jgi:transcriptional antiterminator RfaH
MATSWYCCRTKPLLETTAQRRLRDQSFITYLPMLTRRRPHKGRVIEFHEPLFRNYLFVQLDISDNIGQHWRQINNTRAVSSLLPRSEAPDPISAIEVEALQQAEGEGYFRSGMILPGDRVKVFRGTLVGQVLKCIECRKNRIIALWSCLGSQTRVVLSLADVGVLQ